MMGKDKNDEVCSVALGIYKPRHSLTAKVQRIRKVYKPFL